MNNLTTKPIKYDVTVEDIKAMIEKYKGLEIIPDDKESYDKVYKGYRVFVKTRTGIDKQRKAGNQAAQDHIKNNNKLGTELKELFASGETDLKSKLNAEDDRLRAIEEEEALKEKERIDGLIARIATIRDYGLKVRDRSVTLDQINSLISEFEKIKIDDTLEEFKDEAQRIYDETLDILYTTKKEQEAIEKQKKEQAEAQVKLDKQKAEQEEAQRKIDEDNARIKKEQDEAQKKIDDEKAALEKEKTAEQERKDREKFEEETKAKAEKEAAEKAEKEKQEQESREQAEKEEAEKLESLKPDKDKLLMFLGNLEGFCELDKSEFESAEFKILYTNVLDSVNGTIGETRELIKNI